MSSPLSEFVPVLHDPPEAILSLSDFSLRQRGLETWAAADQLAAILVSWREWSIYAKKGERDMGYALNLENGAALCICALLAHGATVATAAEEALRGFPRVPHGPIQREADDAFEAAVRAALPALDSLEGELTKFLDLLTIAPAAAFSQRAAQRDGPDTIAHPAAKPQREETAGGIMLPEDRFLDFTGKQRKLLIALAGKGKVAIADVLRAVYNSMSRKNLDALLKLKDRANKALVSKRPSLEIKKEGDTLRLQSD
jgi:hypothetical protein